MQEDPQYTDVVEEVYQFLEKRILEAEFSGIPADQILVDPGIGFGKTLAHNLALLRALPLLAGRLGRPLLVGLSRKRMLPALVGREVPAAQRDQLSHLLHAQIAASCGILRVHDVSGACDAVRLCLGGAG